MAVGWPLYQHLVTKLLSCSTWFSLFLHVSPRSQSPFLRCWVKLSVFWVNYCIWNILLIFQVEGITDSVHSALCLFLEIYELDCQHHGDVERVLFLELLHRTAELPWETKAKYLFLSVLLPYLGSAVV